MYILGVDLGQVSDPTALAILEEQPQTAAYDVVELKRWPLQTSYPSIVADLERLVATTPLRGQCALVVDQTGVGRAVVDMLREAKLPRLTAISIHGGDGVTQQGTTVRTPKRDLVSVVQRLLQERRLRIAKALPEAPTLTHELSTFRVRIDPMTAHDAYSSWRERDHDDLVLAVALAAWWAQYRKWKRAGTWPLII